MLRWVAPLLALLVLIASYAAYGTASSESPWWEVLGTVPLHLEAPWFDVGDGAARVLSALIFWASMIVLVVLLLVRARDAA